MFNRALPSQEGVVRLLQMSLVTRPYLLIKVKDALLLKEVRVIHLFGAHPMLFEGNRTLHSSAHNSVNTPEHYGVSNKVEPSAGISRTLNKTSTCTLL